jgi:two-component system, OmpR family, phosphate regulon sensor histidine kinase PhoR
VKKNIILLVIIAITISLLGLVGIQLYWIRNAVAVKESNFERGVGEAITAAVYKYNKIILAKKLLLQDRQAQQLKDIFINLDSINKTSINRNSKLKEDSDKHFNDTSIISIDGSLFLQLKQSFEEETSNSDTDYLYQYSNRAFLKSDGYLKSPTTDNQKEQNLIERSKIINELLEDLFADDATYKLYADINKQVLDSIIKHELNNQGINTTFEFGIYNSETNSLTKEKTGKYTKELLENGYIFSLFPGTIFHNPEYLVVYFPAQKQYLIAQMTAMLLTSTILIIVIISSFAYTIITLIRQKKLSMMKNDFINNMTHELKTPISTISLACQALSDQDVQKSERLYQNYINIIDEENQRLEMMTEKVLQTALMEKGKLKLNKSYIDIHDILNDAIIKIGLQVQRTNGHITKQFRAKQSIINVDKFHITNIFFNLLDNANKYSESEPEIIVSTENNPEGIFVNVKDNGIGISKANQQKVFDNLYRISTGNIHNVKGFGLGLAYVKNIIELHGGEIFLESEIKKGSTFTIFVPFGDKSNL